ncbi:MAG TPA: carboxypeptidase regulatory-like domain-containing protein [Planctomycetota bacterium]|nr:carboxypeptidase regulatory-like domain-containing protein [Planctomycetota bacterium]
MGKGRKVLLLTLLALGAVEGAIWWLAADHVSESVPTRDGAPAAPKSPDAESTPPPSVLPQSGEAAGVASLAPEKPTVEPLAEGDVRATFRGRVVDEAGRPVAGAVVRHYPSTWKRKQLNLITSSNWRVDLTLLARTETDAQGRFALPVVEHPPATGAAAATGAGIGQGTPSLLVMHPGFESRAVGCAGWQGGDLDAGDIALVAGAVLVGRAVDERGQPLAGVTLEPSLFGGPEGGPRGAERDVLRYVQSDVTGADGRFAFDGLGAGPFELDVRGPGHRPAIVKAELLPGESHDVGDVVLQAGAVIEGQVLDAGGQPVPRAKLVARPARNVEGADLFHHDILYQFTTRWSSGGTATDVEGEADEQGAFRFDSLDAANAPFVIFGGAAGFEPVRSASVSPGDAPLELTLPRAASILLTLVAPESGEPIVGATVQGLRQVVPDDPQGSGSPVPLTVTSEPTELQAAGVPPPFEGLYLLSPAGTMRNTAIVSAPGYATRGYVLPTVAAPERGTFRAKLPREARATGVVVDARDQPIVGATVTLAPPESLRVDLPPVSDTTDAGGRFTFGQLAGGDWTATASAPHFVTSPPHVLELREGKVRDELRIVLQPAGAIEGVVLLAGQPLPGATVNAISIAQAAANKATQEATVAKGGSVSWSGKPAPGESRVVTDTEGRFRIADLAPESFQLSGPPGVAVVVDVKAGETTEITLLARAKPRVHGRVSDARGPVKDVWLLAEQHADPLPGWLSNFNYDPSQTDAQGLFELELAEPGHFRISASQRDATTQLVELDLAWDQTEWLDLVFPGGAVRGRVVEADGSTPVAGAKVALGDIAKISGPYRSAGNCRSTKTDADGRFEFPRVAAAAFAVFVVEDGHVEPPAVRVDVPEGGAPAEVLLALQLGARIQGHVTALGGTALPGKLRVRATGLDGQPGVASAKVQKDGSFQCTQLAPGRWRCELAVDETASPLQAREATVAAGEVGAAEFEVAF